MEINVWKRKALPETRKIESELTGVLADREPREAVDICLAYFDGFFAGIDPDAAAALIRRLETSSRSGR
jgi:hypothetical protein